MPDFEDLAFLRVDRSRPGVALVTLDDPDRRNVMSDEMTRSWTTVMAALADDPDLRCVVVTGAGTAFCSGGDIGWIASDPDASVDDLRNRMLPFYRAWLAVRDLEVPTIAAINGPAIGAGLCMPLACDIRYAAAGARVGAPFVKLGLHPGMAATHLFPDVVGRAAARDLLLTGRIVTADEALALGLVSRVLPAETFLDEVLEAAAGVAAAAPLASRLTKVALAGAGHRDIDAALEWEALAQPITMATEDLQEGISAAQAKRAPRFRGR